MSSMDVPADRPRRPVIVDKLEEYRDKFNDLKFDDVIKD